MYFHRENEDVCKRELFAGKINCDEIISISSDDDDERDSEATVSD